MYTDASLVRRPQAHLPLSGSNFDLCNDVFLDSYNEPEPEFVADATPSAPYLGPTNVCKCPGATGRLSCSKPLSPTLPPLVGGSCYSASPVNRPSPEDARFARRARGPGTATERRRTLPPHRSHALNTAASLRPTGCPV